LSVLLSLFIWMWLLAIIVLFFKMVKDYGKSQRKLEENWLSWPTLEMYWDRHPGCRTKNGTKCHNCGSRQIHNFGWGTGYDPRRIHKCMQCNTTLYRTKS
jgi:hypothetical protein